LIICFARYLLRGERRIHQTYTRPSTTNSKQAQPAQSSTAEHSQDQPSTAMPIHTQQIQRHNSDLKKASSHEPSRHQERSQWIQKRNLADPRGSRMHQQLRSRNPQRCPRNRQWTEHQIQIIDIDFKRLPPTKKTRLPGDSKWIQKGTPQTPADLKCTKNDLVDPQRPSNESPRLRRMNTK
jgi:hypothetical protein